MELMKNKDMRNEHSCNSLCVYLNKCPLALRMNCIKCIEMYTRSSVGCKGCTEATYPRHHAMPTQTFKCHSIPWHGTIPCYKCILCVAILGDMEN